MALKKKITKDDFEKLPKDVKENYTLSGEDYILDLEEDSAAELKRAKDREAAANTQLRKEKKALEDKIAALEAGEEPPLDPDLPNNSKDIEKLQKQWDRKFKKLEETAAAREAELTSKQAARDARIKKTMIDSAALEIATKISTVPALMQKNIAERFDVEFGEDGEPELVILGANGKRSNMTSEQLSKEFVANKDFASIIVGSKASGSSGTSRESTRQKPSGARGSGDEKPADLSKMNRTDLVSYLKEKRESEQQQ